MSSLVWPWTPPVIANDDCRLRRDDNLTVYCGGVGAAQRCSKTNVIPAPSTTTSSTAPSDVVAVWYATEIQPRRAKAELRIPLRAQHLIWIDFAATPSH